MADNESSDWRVGRGAVVYDGATGGTSTGGPRRNHNDAAKKQQNTDKNDILGVQRGMA